MARPRAKNSKHPFAGMGFDKLEEEELKKRLAEKDISFRRLVRHLVKEWIKETRPR